MTGRGQCLGTGRCCDPVALPYRYAILTERQRSEIEPENRRWIEEHLTEVLPRRQGLDAVADYMQSGRTTALLGGEVVTIITHFYTCDLFDPDTRRCTAYAERPPICAGYPWYGAEPDPTKAMPHECGYGVDIGRTPVSIRTRT